MVTNLQNSIEYYIPYKDNRGGRNARVIYYILKTPARRLTPSDRKDVYVKLLEYLVPCISLNGLLLFEDEENEMDQQTDAPRHRTNGQRLE